MRFISGQSKRHSNPRHDWATPVSGLHLKPRASWLRHRSNRPICRPARTHFKPRQIYDHLVVRQTPLRQDNASRGILVARRPRPIACTAKPYMYRLARIRRAPCRTERRRCLIAPVCRFAILGNRLIIGFVPLLNAYGAVACWLYYCICFIELTAYYAD